MGKLPVLLILGVAILTVTVAAAAPDIRFTSVPRIGTFATLKGRVSGVPRSGFRVAVYIRVQGGWWTKPYAAEPLTAIRKRGRWRCDITTGGVDEEATEIAAFLVPATYVPPRAAGDETLAAELVEHAVATTSATR